MDGIELKQKLLNGKKTDRIIFAVTPDLKRAVAKLARRRLRIHKRIHLGAFGRRGRKEGCAVNESDVRLKLIDPALKKEWNADRQIFTEYCFTDGEIVVRKGLHNLKEAQEGRLPAHVQTGYAHRHR